MPPQSDIWPIFTFSFPCYLQFSIKSASSNADDPSLPLIQSVESGTVFHNVCLLKEIDDPGHTVGPLLYNIDPCCQAMPFEIYVVCSQQSSWKNKKQTRGYRTSVLCHSRISEWLWRMKNPNFYPRSDHANGSRECYFLGQNMQSLGVIPFIKLQTDT